MTHAPSKTDVQDLVEKALCYWCTSAKTHTDRATFVCGALCIAEIYELQEDDPFHNLLGHSATR